MTATTIDQPDLLLAKRVEIVAMLRAKLALGPSSALYRLRTIKEGDHEIVSLEPVENLETLADDIILGKHQH